MNTISVICLSIAIIIIGFVNTSQSQKIDDLQSRIEVLEQKTK